MKTPRPIFLLLVICALGATAPLRAEPNWQTDFKKAQEEAKKTHKLIFVEFTGSDWCPPCMQFKRNILSTGEFEEYAKKNFVLVELDFPRHKLQPPDVTKQNQELAMKFGIEAFPSVLILNAEGKKIGEFEGFDPRLDVKGYIEEFEKARKG